MKCFNATIRTIPGRRVRVGGSPYFPMPYRWGYGWPYPRRYKALTEDESRKSKHNLSFIELLLTGIAEDMDFIDQSPSDEENITTK